MRIQDPIEIKLKADIVRLLSCGELPQTEDAANFKSGIVSILPLQIVQSSVHRRDKVYDVNVIGNGDHPALITLTQW